MSDRLTSRRPSRSDVPVAPYAACVRGSGCGQADCPVCSRPPGVTREQAARFPAKVAANIAPTSASPTNPNRAKRKLGKRVNTPRTSVKRDGLTRSGVTVMRVDPATLKRSTAGGRNTSDKVLNSADVLARNVLSRRSIRKTALSA